MSLKILLINPPYKPYRGFNREGRCTHESSFWGTSWPPYSLASIAACIRAGNTLELFDCPVQNITSKKLLSFIDIYKPDILISSISTQTINDDLSLLNGIKRKINIPTVIFGVHATIFAEDILRNNLVDFVIRHEPEITIKELVDKLKDGNSLRDVKGLAYKSKNNEIVITEKREFITDLDALPFPAWDHVDLSKYRLPLSGKNFVIVNTARGCPFQCSFCTTKAYYGRRLRLRSVSSLIEEIKLSINRYKIRDIFFWGDTFTLNKVQVKELCEKIINENLKIRWMANGRVDTVDEELLYLMKKAGCWIISYGIESGNNSILKECYKKITVEKVKETVDLTRSLGIRIAGHFIFGLPGETVSSAKDTIKLIKELKLDFIAVYAAVPFPGSLLYDKAVSQGWIKGKDWSQFNYSEFVMDLPTISKNELYKFKKKAYYVNYIKLRSFKTAFSSISFRSLFSTLTKAIKYFFIFK